MGECQKIPLWCAELSVEIISNHCDYSTVSGTKVFVMPGGMMKSNGNLVELIEKVKPEIRTLIEKCNTVSKSWQLELKTFGSSFFSVFPKMFSFPQVKMWVQLLIPRIEDGNNFGVSIQEETVAELRTVEGEAASYLDQISRFILFWLTFSHLLYSDCWLFCLFLLLDITSHGQSLFPK